MELYVKTKIDDSSVISLEHVLAPPFVDRYVIKRRFGKKKNTTDFTKQEEASSHTHQMHLVFFFLLTFNYICFDNSQLSLFLKNLPKYFPTVVYLWLTENIYNILVQVKKYSSKLLLCGYMKTCLLSSNNNNNQLPSKLYCSILNVHRSCVFLVEMYVTREPSHKTGLCMCKF